MRITSWTSISIAAGLVTHFFYRRYEPRSFLVHFSLLLGLPNLANSIFSIYSGGQWTGMLSAYITYLGTITLSTISYRLSPFHPLSRYPGKRHVVLKQLHDRYGPYVRIAPNELSCIDANAIHPVLGADGFPKGPRWDARKAFSNSQVPHNLIAIRSPTEHSARRRVWARAFTASAVKEYQPSIIKRTYQLIDILCNESSKHGDVDVAKWIGFFTFDFMGDMAFGGGFETMIESKDHEFIYLMHRNLKVATQVEQLGWASRLFFKLPSITSDIFRFKYKSFAKAKVRFEEKQSKRDLFYYLIDESDSLPADKKPTLKQITSDSTLAMTAGSDTASSALVNCLYLLTRYPVTLEQLQKEVDAHCIEAGEDENSLFDSQTLANMKYLNAVINETLRLFPPVPSGSERAPYPGTGTRVFLDNVIPEGNCVIIPTYALQRDPRYFSPHPDSFWPERWLIADGNIKSAPQGFVHNTTAFVPFSYGPANCVGMRAALLEIRIALLLLVRRFSFEPASGGGKRALENYESTMEDWFAISLRELKLKLIPRFESVGL